MNIENKIKDPKNNFFSMYIWAIKTSYSYMQGNRNLSFWLKLPFKAFQITRKTLVNNKHK